MDDLEREKKWKTVELEGLFKVGRTQNKVWEGVSGFALLCTRVSSPFTWKTFQSIGCVISTPIYYIFVKTSSKTQRLQGPPANYEMGLWSLWVCSLNNKYIVQHIYQESIKKMIFSGRSTKALKLNYFSLISSHYLLHLLSISFHKRIASFFFMKHYKKIFMVLESKVYVLWLYMRRGLNIRSTYCK